MWLESLNISFSEIYAVSVSLFCLIGLIYRRNNRIESALVTHRYNVEKYCTARQATDDNMAKAHSMLDI